MSNCARGLWSLCRRLCLVVFLSIRGIAVLLLEPPSHSDLKVRMSGYSENQFKGLDFLFSVGLFFPYEVPQNICRLYESCKNLVQTLGVGVLLVAGGLLADSERRRSDPMELQRSSVLCQRQQILLQYL